MKKVILIAGGSRGIGRYLTETLGNNFLISVCSRNIEYKEGNDFLFWKCDLRNREETKSFINATLNKFGKIDVVIYNAGLMLYDDLLEVKEKDIDAMYEVIVKGYLFLCQEIIPIMRKQEHGYIINISSTRGITTALNKAAYSAMKRAAKSLTDSITIENKLYGIKAASICPGVVNTESSREMYGGAVSGLNPIKEDDIVKTVLLLLSLSKNAHIDTIVIGGKL
jgi:NADP-dependent 3-hydroxy acid dehydrogenase YdfG